MRSKSNNTNNRFTSGFVMVDRRVNSSHPLFKGDAITLAIFCELVTRMAHEPTTDNLGKTKNGVPLKPKQTLTSFRTLAKALGFPKHLIEPRIQKLIDGMPPKIPGLITKVACKGMPGMSVNDGMVITILSGAKFGSQPDTKPDDVNNTGTNTGKRKKFTPPTYDMVLAYAEEKRWDNASALADRFFEYYQSTGWIKEKVGKPVRNWKLTMCDWQDRQGNRQSIKAVKGSGNPNTAKAGPEALLASDMAAIGSVA